MAKLVLPINGGKTKTLFWMILVLFSLTACNAANQSDATQLPATDINIDTPFPSTTPTPIPTSTSTVTPTATPTPDPERAWPEFPTGMPPVIPPEYIAVMESFPEEQYGISATEHYKPITKPGIVYTYPWSVELIERTENGFRITYWYTFYPQTNIENIRTEGNWVYLEINSIPIRVKKGTAMEIIPVPSGMDLETKSLSEIEYLDWGGTILFDPTEKKFYYLEQEESFIGDTSKTPIIYPLYYYKIFLFESGPIQVKPADFPSSISRDKYCGLIYEWTVGWKWKDSNTVHTPWVDGCPRIDILSSALTNPEKTPEINLTMQTTESVQNPRDLDEIDFPTSHRPNIEVSTSVLNPFPSKLYGVKGDYGSNIAMIEKQGSSYIVESSINNIEINIEVTGHDTKWIYLTINSTKLRVRPGTILLLICLQEKYNPSTPINYDKATILFFDPSEQKFLIPRENEEIPPTMYTLESYSDGKVLIKAMDQFGYETREGYCDYVFYYLIPIWKWKDSQIVHDPWVEGCPNVELDE